MKPFYFYIQTSFLRHVTCIDCIMMTSGLISMSHSTKGVWRMPQASTVDPDVLIFMLFKALYSYKINQNKLIKTILIKDKWQSLEKKNHLLHY